MSALVQSHVPLTDEGGVCYMGIGSSMENIDVELGDAVKVIAGPFCKFCWHHKRLIPIKRTVVVKLSIFGRGNTC